MCNICIDSFKFATHLCLTCGVNSHHSITSLIELMCAVCVHLEYSLYTTVYVHVQVSQRVKQILNMKGGSVKTIKSIMRGKPQSDQSNFSIYLTFLRAPNLCSNFTSRILQNSQPLARGRGWHQLRVYSVSWLILTFTVYRFLVLIYSVLILNILNFKHIKFYAGCLNAVLR